MMNKENNLNLREFADLIIRYIQPNWKLIVLLVALTIAGNFFTIVQPIFISGLIQSILSLKDGVVNHDALSELSSNSSIMNLNYIGEKVQFFVHYLLNNLKIDYLNSVWPSLILMMVIFLIIVLIGCILNYAAMVTSRWIRADATKRIRLDLMNHLFSLHLGYFDNIRSGVLISRVMQDATNTAHGLGPLVQSIFHQGFLIIMYSIYLFCTNKWLTVGSLIFMLGQFAITQLIRKPLKKAVRNTFDKMADITSVLQEILVNIRVIKSFGAENYEIKKITRDILNSKSADFKEGIVRQLERYIREFLDSFAIIGVFGLASIQFMHDKLTLQGFIMFVYVGRLLITPINKFMVNITWMQALLASYDRLHTIFQIKPAIENGTIKKVKFEREIQISNINFEYEPKRNILNDLSLNIKKGEVVAIVGPSGSGKSTIVDLILRFYLPQSGKITLDDVSILEYEWDSYRKLFGVVPQECTLFNDSILNNIVYGREAISNEDVISASKIANADEFIMSFPDGYNTFVGDRGVRLSGGQRQRIAIARAIVAKPDILVFDEATSSLDTTAEQQVQVAIDNILQKNTAIVIAHRISTVTRANKIVVLDNGRIICVGTHKQLIENNSLYKKLYLGQLV